MPPSEVVRRFTEADLALFAMYDAHRPTDLAFHLDLMQAAIRQVLIDAFASKKSNRKNIQDLMFNIGKPKPKLTAEDVMKNLSKAFSGD
jgi:hypothetical protein